MGIRIYKSISLAFLRGRPYIPVMGMSAQEIERLVKEAIPDAVIELTDLAGDNDHFSIVVTSAAFQGKTRVQQHQMVFNALKGGMGTKLHALAVTTITPPNGGVR